MWPVYGIWWRCCCHYPQEAGTHGPSARLPVVIYNFGSLLSLVNNLAANTSLMQVLPHGSLKSIPQRFVGQFWSNQTSAETKFHPSKEMFIITKDVDGWGWPWWCQNNVTNAVFGTGTETDSVFYLKEWLSSWEDVIHLLLQLGHAECLGAGELQREPWKMEAEAADVRQAEESHSAPRCRRKITPMGLSLMKHL